MKEYKKFKNQMNCDWRYDFIIKSKVDDTFHKFRNIMQPIDKKVAI